MESSWRYRHVAIKPYSIGGFYRLAFCFNGRDREFTLRWKTKGLHQSKQKDKLAQLAGPTFSQHFPTHVSPHYIQLDPIYYGGYCPNTGIYCGWPPIEEKRKMTPCHIYVLKGFYQFHSCSFLLSQFVIQTRYFPIKLGTKALAI
jgi:hypothetical protein